MESWLMAVDCIGRHAGSGSYIQGSTCNHKNEGKTNNLGWMLYSVYAVLGVNWWSCDGEIQRDDLTFHSAMMIEMWLRKREMGDEDWERCGGPEQIWKIKGTTSLIGSGWPHIGDITHRFVTRSCCIGDGKLTGTRNSLQSQFLMMISPSSLIISLSCP